MIPEADDGIRDPSAGGGMRREVGGFWRGFESRAHRACWYFGYEISEVDRMGVMGERDSWSGK